MVMRNPHAGSVLFCGIQTYWKNVMQVPAEYVAVYAVQMVAEWFFNIKCYK